MLTKTKLVIVAVAALGFASSAAAASRHHMHHWRYAHSAKHHAHHVWNMHHARALRASYPRDMYLYSPWSSRFSGYAGYPDKYCTSCNLGSY